MARIIPAILDRCSIPPCHYDRGLVLYAQLQDAIIPHALWEAPDQHQRDNSPVLVLWYYGGCFVLYWPVLGAGGDAGSLARGCSMLWFVLEYKRLPPVDLWC